MKRYNLAAVESKIGNYVHVSDYQFIKDQLALKDKQLKELAEYIWVLVQEDRCPECHRAMPYNYHAENCKHHAAEKLAQHLTNETSHEDK